MIISHKWKFVFVKGQKVAGTSVEIMLSSLCGPEDVIAPITPIDERKRREFGGLPPQNFGGDPEEVDQFIKDCINLPQENLGDVKRPKGRFYNHSPLTDVLDVMGEIPNDYTVFCVERSPYHKIISYANHQLRFKHYIRGQEGDDTERNLKRIGSVISRSPVLHKVRNIGLYKDYEGIVRTQALRYENLEEELRGLLYRLGMQDVPAIPHAKKMLSANNLNPEDVLAPDDVEWINEKFREEFETFGYSMISPSQNSG